MDKVDCEQVALFQDVQPDPPRSNRTHLRLLTIAGLLSLALLMHHYWPTTIFRGCIHGLRSEPTLAFDDICPQVVALTSSKHETLLRNLDDEFGSDKFRLRAYELLGGAVRIPTEAHDNLPTDDPRWGIMGEFHKYLESRFPAVHANLKRTKVNKYALLYEWKGTEDVKPLLLAAHMDVVPVNPDTYDDWIHPPYSGYYDGEFIWGRGSSDDKSSLIAILITIESLLERGFAPSRTIFLAFGIDEEIGGRQGARAIATHLLEMYGPDSLAMIVDEGGGLMDRHGILFASPGVGEKGFMNIRMDVFTPGGHSSTPPKHTGIGILADLITELEAHPHQPVLVRGGPYYQSLECRAKYDAGFPDSLKRLLLDSQTSDKKLRELGDRLMEFDPSYYVYSGTTQAIDLIGGGVKVNALPEVAWAAANHRIATDSSSAELMSRFTDITFPVAARHNMVLEAFGKTVGSHDSSAGTIRLSDFNNNAFNPSPLTPTKGSGPYMLLSGTILSTIETRLRSDNITMSAIVSPGLNRGNTDTRHYWDLTRHIFRYHHIEGRDHIGLHTVNEAIRAEAFLEEIRFFTRLILNADRSGLLE